MVDQHAYLSSGGQQHAMAVQDVCPPWQSPKYKTNGRMHTGQQHHHGHDCGRQCVDGFEQYLIPDDRRALIERWLVERISLRGIYRAVGVTLKWLLGVLVRCIAALPDHLHVQLTGWTPDIMVQHLEVEADAMASFVHN
jgi:hypothetical protein